MNDNHTNKSDLAADCGLARDRDWFVLYDLTMDVNDEIESALLIGGTVVV